MGNRWNITSICTGKHLKAFNQLPITNKLIYHINPPASAERHPEQLIFHNSRGILLQKCIEIEGFATKTTVADENVPITKIYDEISQDDMEYNSQDEMEDDHEEYTHENNTPNDNEENQIMDYVVEPTTQYNQPSKQYGMYQHAPNSLHYVKELPTALINNWTHTWANKQPEAYIPSFKKKKARINKEDITVKPDDYINDFLGIDGYQVMLHATTQLPMKRGLKKFGKHA